MNHSGIFFFYLFKVTPKSHTLLVDTSNTESGSMYYPDTYVYILWFNARKNKILPLKSEAVALN